jgi:hypothetical protein
MQPGRDTLQHRRVSGWVQWSALTALLLATPIVQQTLTEAASLIAHDDCGCDDDCRESGHCPGPCQTCLCCVHCNMITTASLVMPRRSALRTPLQLQGDDRSAEGHLSRPFRPPIA